jgi:hypothetical protein
MKKIYVVVLFAFISITSYAQYNYRDSNRIGITVGVNQFNLATTNFVVQPDLGWNAGLSVRGNFYNNWDMVYAMQFSENNFTVATTNPLSVKEEVKYKLPSAQISLQLSYILIENHLSLEFGPLVQVNGKFKIEGENEKNTINGTSLLAKNITDISKFNFYPVVGITAGVKHFRVNFQYQYGATNMLGNLNSKGYSTNFKGNPSTLSANLLIYL